MGSHTVVPVSAAAAIARQFAKSVVVIISHDPASNLIHTTTYGVVFDDKIVAAQIGERCAKLICGEGLDYRQTHEDFRLVDQAKRAKEIEVLKRECEWALAWLTNVNVDEWHNVVARLARALITAGGDIHALNAVIEGAMNDTFAASVKAQMRRADA